MASTSAAAQEATEALVEQRAADAPCKTVARAAEQRVARIARIRESLGTDKTPSPLAKTIYRDIASRSQSLTDAEFRLLNTLMRFADSDLTNCFVGVETLQRHLGGRVNRCTGYAITAYNQRLGRRPSKGLECGRRRGTMRVRMLLKQLVTKGWVARLPLDETEDRVRSNDLGRFISAVGTQFRLPSGEIAPGEPGWKGPVSFPKRWWGQRPRVHPK